MRRDPDRGGIWAPFLTYADGLFWLIYTDVKRRDGAWKDSHNYLVTTSSIEGPWSDRVYLNSSGFDPSLFHDEDGRKWLLNMIWDHNQIGGDRFGGMVMQEYLPEDRKLIGPVRNIYRGSDLKLTEGPHLYRKASFYYLLTASALAPCGYSAASRRVRPLNTRRWPAAKPRCPSAPKRRWRSSRAITSILLASSLGMAASSSTIWR